MKKIIKVLPLILLPVAVFVLNACQSTKSASAGKMLRFDLANGKAYDYEMIMNMDQTIMGQSVQMDMTTYYSMEVKADDGTLKTIDSKVERLKMKTAAMGLNLDIDTDDPVGTDTTGMSKDPVTAMKVVFGAIKGQRFTMKVDREGKIREVTGFENIADKMVGAFDLDEEQKELMKKNLDQQFNGEEVSSSFERFWYIFPNKEVKTGDSWTRTSEMKGKMPGVYKSTYTVTDIEGDMVTLEETTEISQKEGEEISFSGSIKGKVVVDSRSGLMVNADQDMSMKATMDKGMGFEIKGKSRIRGRARN